MGKASREKPARLGEKLVQIREAFGFSQNEMIRHLALEGIVSRNNLSSYEVGRREPSLLVLLKYARAVRAPMDVLVDDKLDLPERLRSIPKHEAIRQKRTS
jgi:transcriptional regulator with XRE-family HTH domain